MLGNIGPQRHQAIGILVRQGAQHHRINDAEGGRVLRRYLMPA